MGTSAVYQGGISALSKMQFHSQPSWNSSCFIGWNSSRFIMAIFIKGCSINVDFSAQIYFTVDLF
jgi:hypothetical protein